MPCAGIYVDALCWNKLWVVAVCKVLMIWHASIRNVTDLKAFPNAGFNGGWVDALCKVLMIRHASIPNVTDLMVVSIAGVNNECLCKPL
jgi:hypothetical protein